MCGRFVRTSPAEVIAEEFGVTSSAPVDLQPRYNVCPGEVVAAVVQHGDERRLGGLRWGLEISPRSRSHPINLRCETASRRFGEALRKRRCLIVADGFYEWRREGRHKLPFFIRLAAQRPFAFAGIWQRAAEPEGVATTAILTCPPNGLVAGIHDRMPVILDRESAGRWLDPALDAAGMSALFAPLPNEKLEAFAVTPLVNSPRNDSPELIHPLGAALREPAEPA